MGKGAKGPYKFGPKRREMFLDQIRSGQRRSLAADNVNISRETIRKYYNEDPAFRDRVDIAEVEANDHVEDALFQTAMSGDMRAIEVWLYNRLPERWTDRRQAKVQHSGQIDSRNEEHYYIVQEIVDDPEVAERIRENFRRRAGGRVSEE